MSYNLLPENRISNGLKIVRKYTEPSTIDWQWFQDGDLAVGHDTDEYYVPLPSFPILWRAQHYNAGEDKEERDNI